jgi:hypothetical protein
MVPAANASVSASVESLAPGAVTLVSTPMFTSPALVVITTSGRASWLMSPTTKLVGSPRVSITWLQMSVSPARAMSMYAMWADFSKSPLLGGEPQSSGPPLRHEQRPSPPKRAAASIAAISFSGMSPEVVRAASTAACTTGAPASTLP